jgi:hypothetical protein
MSVYTRLHVSSTHSWELDFLPYRRYGLFPATSTRERVQHVSIGTAWRAKDAWCVTCTTAVDARYLEMRHAGDGSAGVIYVQGGAVLKVTVLPDRARPWDPRE